MPFPKRLIFSIILSFFLFISGYSQTTNPTIVRGLVTDAETDEPLPFVYIQFDHSVKSSIADVDGVFSIETADTLSNLKVSVIGYETSFVHIETGKNQYVHIKLKPQAKLLAEFVVKGKRKRYKNAGNPAVKLIEKVIEHKPLNRMENIDYLQYEKYQKILFSFNNISSKLEQNRLLQPFRFIFANTDTTIVSGKKLLPVYLKENISDCYSRKKPPASVEVSKAEKLVRFDEYLNRKSLSVSINYLYQDINIYDNNVTLLSNQFLSPIALMAPAFYKFYIQDTIVIDNIRCINLSFVPRSKGDFLFQGNIFVTLDSSYAVKKISLEVNKDINLNWVKSISIVQEFQKIGSGWLLSRNEMNADFGITEESLGLYGQKTVSYKNYQINANHNDSVFRVKQSTLEVDPEDRDEAYWEQNRPIRLRPSEQNVYILMDSLKRVPAFKRDMDIISLFTLGYLNMGYFELGPISTVYSQNPIEGSRYRIGGRTTRKFNKKLFLETYVAYGFTDQKYKSQFNAVYSLNDKSIRQFPLKSLGASFEYDLKIPGQDLQYAQDDNILLSIKRGVNDKMYYNRRYRLEHINEFNNHFSYSLAYEYSQINPTGNLYFNTTSYSAYTSDVNHISVGQASLDLRYAPHEKYIQGSMYRILLPNQYPVLELKYTAGSKLFGGDYDFQKFQANVSKRFLLSLLGYTDVSLEAGKVFGRVPYLLLDIHRANQTYAYQAMSYNLMNFLEFVSDEYVALNVDHSFNGFFFNRVPLLKKFKLREAVTFKILYGELSNTNNPSVQTDLFKLPTDNLGSPLTFTLEKKPYVEAGFAITNIVKFFRVDFVQRFSYLDHPGISKTGIRFSYKLDF